MFTGIERAHDIDAWLAARFASDPVAAQVAAHAAASGLKDIAVSANLGRLLRFLVELTGARNALEVGTFGGYSGAWIARGLGRDGLLVTIENNPVAATIAEQSFGRLTDSARIDLRVGKAEQVLTLMRDEGGEPFDFLFLDGSRWDYPAHLELAKPLLRSGALVVADNVIWDGDILDNPDGASARYLGAIHDDPELESVVLPIIRNALDGVSLSRWLPR